MSSILSPYPSSPPLSSPLIEDPPDAILSIADLRAELELLQQKAYERAKKAINNLKAIEECVRRMKEKEKARAIEKSRKDTICACFCIRFPTLSHVTVYSTPYIPSSLLLTRTLSDVNVACDDLTRDAQRKWRGLIHTFNRGWL